MPEDASFKRDVKIDVSRKRISLDVCEKPVLVGDLAHGISKDDSEWFVEDDLDDWFAADDTRYLVVALKKLESYVDWPSPLTAADGAEGGTARRLLIGGGSDEAQQKATAQQLASYQVLQKLPSAVRGDVYAREPSDDGGALSDTLYFVGKVIAETASPTMSLATQGVLVKEHARRYLPTVFGGVPDERIVLWLAPGNTEMRVAQNEIRLEQWAMPPDEVVLPSAGACGFEPETAPPEHVGGADAPFKVRRDAEGKPLGAAFEANIVKPDEVPGAYEAWLKDQ